MKERMGGLMRKSNLIVRFLRESKVSMRSRLIEANVKERMSFLLRMGFLMSMVPICKVNLLITVWKMVDPPS